MNPQEFEQYAREMDHELILNSIKETNKKTKQAIQIGNITIPSDKNLFNQMWLSKAFDKIEPSQRLQISPLSLSCINLHMGRYQWDDYFFLQRENLLHMSPYKIWRDSEYYTTISITIINILTLTSKSKIKNIHNTSDQDCYNSFEDDMNELTEYYLSGPPEALMFPDVDDSTIKYSHPVLLKIFREVVLRYQYLCNRSNAERISIYFKEINELYFKIKFIQKLMYSGIKHVVDYFKQIKLKYLHFDPEIVDINEEPNKFQDISYKEALYKFYIYCISSETTNAKTLCKSYFLGDVIIQYEDIKHLVKHYLISLASCIKHDKLKTVCSHMILAYLKPNIVSDCYIMEKMTNLYC